MKNKLIILIVLVVVVIFFGQFFVPATSPAEQAKLDESATQQTFDTIEGDQVTE